MQYCAGAAAPVDDTDAAAPAAGGASTSIDSSYLELIGARVAAQ